MDTAIFRGVLSRDPRWYQIAVLSGLLIYGAAGLDFDISLPQTAVILATVLATQYLCGRAAGLTLYDPLSAVISGLSLCLLCRTNFLWAAAATAAITIGSKFCLRINGKHLFNPTNFGLVAMLLFTDHIWVSPGQWGSPVYFAFLLACLGGLVATRAARSDVACAFVGCYLALIFARSAWLGEPLAIPLHRLHSGALLLFTFFMISDPKTTPDSRAGRILFGTLVAAGAWYIQFRLYRTNGLLWSLAACAFCTPMIDWLLPGNRYRWDQPHAATREVCHETTPHLPARSRHRISVPARA